MKNLWLVACCLCTVSFVVACDTKTKTVESCGDGFVDPGEECDTTVGELSCASLGHYRPLGTLRCTSDCRLDITECGGRCGDNGVDAADGEECDGANLNGNSCQSLGYHGGTLSCDAECRFVLESCEALGQCGDAVIQDTFEDCDGANLNGQTCETLEQYPGTLACTETCGFELTGCGGSCGDGVIQETFGEACDGAALNGQTCETQGLYPGALTCSEICGLDLTGCGGECGDGILQEAFESCDNGDFGGQDCRLVGGFFGVLTCDGQCVVDTSACRAAELTGTNMSEVGRALVRDATGGLIVGGYVVNAPVFMKRYHADGYEDWTRTPWGMFGERQVSDLALAPSGHVYVTGCTECSTNATGFLSKVSTDGTVEELPVGFSWGRGVVVDAAGNVFVAGYAGGPVDGQTHLGGNDIILSRYDPAGALVWTRQWGTAGDDQAWGLAFDSAGNLVLVGKTDGALDGQVQVGSSDVFVIRCDVNGTKLWTRQLGTTGSDEGKAVATDAAGNLYVFGQIDGALPGQTHLGSYDLFLLRMTSAGDTTWTRQWGTGGWDWAWSVVVDTTGRIHAAGAVEGALPGQTHAGDRDIFLTTYAADGTRVTDRQWGTAGLDQAYDVIVGDDDELFLTGIVSGTLWDRPALGGYDAFILYVPQP